MYEIPKDSTATIVIAFYDWNDNPITPISCDYVLYDKITGKIKRSGSLAPNELAEAIQFVLTETDTAILNQNSRYEILVIALKFKYDTYVKVDEYELKIVNTTVV